jgi:hypothetical protein
MPGPSAAKLGAVRTLIEAAPDSALRSLRLALADAGGGPMASIRDLIDAESADRTIRAWVFSPVLPLFAPRADGVEAPLLPRRALTVLWSQLKARRPELIAQAAEEVRYLTPEDLAPEVLDRLCLEACALVRADPEAILPQAAAEVVESFALYLALSPVARRGARRLPEWLSKVTDERVAALKVLFSDAAAVVDDGAPRLLELLLAHLPEAAQVMRLVSALTDRSGDRYLAASELSSFGERLIADTERRIQRVRVFDPQAGEAGGGAAAQDVIAACATLAELERSVELSRDGPWGARVLAARKALAVNVEGRLREVDAAVGQALPVQSVRVAGRMTRAAPRVEAAPDEQLVARARGLVVLLAEVRPSANDGGYGALRNQVCDKVAARLETYADELIHLINAGEAPDDDHARAYLEVAAEFLGRIRDAKAAQLVRRRAAAAGAHAASRDVA